MPFQPFQTVYSTTRAVLIPADLDDQARARLVGKITAAVRQQSEQAKKCDAVLAVTGKIDDAGDQLVIHHEPARTIDLESIRKGEDRPDIETLWWISESVARALATADPGAPHGGITPASLYQDEFGRIKLGDFGIAPAFESACGVERRRYLHIDGHTWSLLAEDAARESGWITPYFAHEMLAGNQRLNPKSDQFSAGALLYLLGTGVHPYGAGFDDPSLMLYFYLEPFPPNEERTEWTKVFERVEADLGTEADKSIDAWTRFTARLLNSDPVERFADPHEAVAVAEEFIPPALSEMRLALAAGLQALDDGDIEGFLAQATPLRENAAIPALWRETLSRRLGEIEAEKVVLGSAIKLQQLLARGQEAFNSIEIERAREIAGEVAASPQCDEATRSAAEELIAQCDEQEEFVKSGADDLARTYLESATNLIKDDRGDDARAILTGLIQDQNMPTARAAQARDMLAALDLSEQRLEQQEAELDGAERDLREGRLNAARQRLAALLSASELSSEASRRGQDLLEQIETEQKRRAEQVAALDAARSAWERADLETLEKRLADVPADLADPELADIRNDLAARRLPLAAALERLAAIRAALEAGAPERGLAPAGEEVDAEGVPQLLQDELAALVEKCQASVDGRERVRIEQVLGFLKTAENAYDKLDLAECRRRIQREILPQQNLPEHVTRCAEGLLKKCERVEKARELHDYAREHIADRDFDSAAALLDKLSTDGLPALLLATHGELKADVAQARREREEHERRRAKDLLDETGALLAHGKLSDVAKGLERLTNSDALTAEQHERVKIIRDELGVQRPILQAIEQAEDALNASSASPDEILESLSGLPSTRPAWAEERIAATTSRAEELREQIRRETNTQATAVLDAAETAIMRGDADEGRQKLLEATAASEQDATLGERQEKLQALLASLEEWLLKVARIAQTAERGDLAPCLVEIDAALAASPLPAPCRDRLVELKTRVTERIAERRAELDAEAAALAATLAEQGRKVRRFERRVETLANDPLSTDQHRAQAVELLEQWRSAAPPKKSKTRYAIGAAVAVIICATAALYWSGFWNGSAEIDTMPAVADMAEQPLPAETTPVIDEAAAPSSADEREHPRDVVEDTQPSADVSLIEIPSELDATTKTRESETDQPPAVTEAKAAPPAEVIASDQAPSSDIEPEIAPAPAAPTMEEVAAAYTVELRGRLPDDAEASVKLAEDGRFTVEAAWQGRVLSAGDAPRFNDSTNTIEPPASELAEHFMLQIEALRFFEKPATLNFSPTEANAVPPAAVTIQTASTLEIAKANWPERTVTLTGTAKLAADQRPGAAFPFTCTYREDATTADETTRAAFAEYLRLLQAAQADQAVAPISRQLKLPPGMRLKPTDGFAGGPRVVFRVEGADERLYAEIAGDWNADLPRYEIDAEDAFDKLREGLATAAGDRATREHLATVWRELRDDYAAKTADRRVETLKKCELLEVSVTNRRLKEPWAVEVKLTVGPREEEMRLEASGLLRVIDGRLIWDARGGEALMASLLAQAPEIEQSLDDRLDGMAQRRAVDLGVFRDALADVARAKIERYQAPGYQLVGAFAEEKNPEDGLAALSAALRSATTPDPRRDAYPVVFVEYYMGDESVHGLSWRVETDATGAITGVSDAAVWTAVSVEELRGYDSPAAFRSAYSSDETLGERLFGQAFGEALRASGDGSFGVVAAPEGPLWLTRWEQVRFSPRGVSGLDARGAPALGQATSLRTVLSPTTAGRDAETYRRAGLWCVPTLAGVWTGAADKIDNLQLGVLARGHKAQTASFKNWGAAVFASIADPTLAGDFAWMQFARGVGLAELGHQFWDRGWRGETWTPTPYVGFSLIQLQQ